MKELSQVVVSLERFAASTAVGQGSHQAPVEPLVQRVENGQRAELADKFPAATKRESRLDAEFKRLHAPFFQVKYVDVEVPALRYVRQGRASPHRQCHAQERRRIA